MRYELATLQARIGAVPRVVAGVESFVSGPEAKGRLVGCWTTDIGVLNQVLVLRAFANDAEMMAERMRILGSPNAFDAAADIAEMTFDAYAEFEWMTPLTPGQHGSVYEFRTYRIKPGVRDLISRNWQAAVPERTRLTPLAHFMYTLSGAPRITHIWPYVDLAQRTRVRAEAVKSGNWPPKDTGPNLLDMVSIIAVPAAFSPLR